MTSNEEFSVKDFKGTISKLNFGEINSNRIRHGDIDDICILCHTLCSLNSSTVYKYHLVSGRLVKGGDKYNKKKKEVGICCNCVKKYKCGVKYEYIYFISENKYLEIDKMDNILSYTDYIQNKIFTTHRKKNEEHNLKLITSDFDLNKLCCYYEQYFHPSKEANILMMACNIGLGKIANKIINIGYSKEYFKKHGKYLDINTITPFDSTALSEACRTDIISTVKKIIDRKPEYLGLFFMKYKKKYKHYRSLKYYYLKQLKNR